MRTKAVVKFYTQFPYENEKPQNERKSEIIFNM